MVVNSLPFYLQSVWSLLYRRSDSWDWEGPDVVPGIGYCLRVAAHHISIWYQRVGCSKMPEPGRGARRWAVLVRAVPVSVGAGRGRSLSLGNLHHHGFRGEQKTGD